MKIYVCFVTFTALRFVFSQSSTNVPKLREAAGAFSRILDFYVNKMTNYKEFNKDFKKLADDAVFRKINGEEISNNFTSDIEKLFSQKENLLQNLKKNVSELKNAYNYDPNIDDFDYPSSRSMKELFSEYNTSFVRIVKEFPTDVPINQTKSFVHVPTNINDHSKSILNTVRWTENLDQVFMDNQKIDNSIILQYYCDASGLFRMFPGNLNGMNETNVDLYDCRRRLWYQQSAAGPKDVVIVIDRSGSMTGSNIVIAKIAAKSLIDTLEENDYFNVISVGKTASLSDNCVPFLIQATKFNKERMKMAINKIEDPKDILYFNDGINAAFRILNSGVNYNRTYSAGCHKLIMVFSDGIEGDYSAAAKVVFDALNEDKKVRVFSYLVGRVKNPDDRALKEMSCNNRGYFYKIETLANVWDTVAQYLEVLSRSTATSKAEVRPSISPIYLDSSGAGMILTMSLGIFNSHNLTGVVGVDMLIRALKQEVPISSLGFFSHPIIINNNGFIILHSKYRDQGGYLPSPTNVYFEDLEYSVNKNDSKVLKERMLRRENGSMKFLTYWLYDKNRKIAENNMTYYFKPVNNTEIVAALAISDSDISFIEINRSLSNNLFISGVNALLVSNITDNTSIPFFTYVDIPQWMFCHITSDRSDYTVDVKVYPTAAELHNYLSDYEKIDDIIDNCEEELISNLLVNAALVFEHVNQSWQQYLIEKQPEDPDFTTLYIGTRGGYTRYFSLNSTNIPERDSLRISLFEQAVAMPSYTIIMSTPNRSTYIDEVVFIQVTASSWMELNGERVLMAVTGTDMNSGLLKEIFENVTSSIQLNCKENNTVTCAVIDQNGYIVVSNQGERAIGAFFGQYHAKLMEFFARPDISIFRQIALEDSQAVCLESKYYDSAANILFTPAKFLLSVVLWLINSIWRVFFQMFMLGVFLLQKNKVDLQDNNNINISCTKNMSFFLFQNDKWEDFYAKEIEQLKKNKRSPTTLRIECAPSKFQYFVLAVIPDTNLIFIVVDSPPDNSCLQKPMELVVDKDQRTDFCNQEEPFRVVPGFCYNDSLPIEETSEYCGSDYTVHPSIIIINLQITFLYFLYDTFV